VRVALLSGGVGGARFTLGVLAAEPAAAVTVVANVGDDLEHWGLSISPDLDTLLYTLTGRIHPEQGWGVAGDTREAMAVVAELGGVDWFILGDRDIGLHLVRTQALRSGASLSEATARLARKFGGVFKIEGEVTADGVLVATGSVARAPGRSGHTSAQPASSSIRWISGVCHEGSRNSKAARMPSGSSPSRSARRPASTGNLGGSWNRTGPSRGPSPRARSHSRRTGSPGSRSRRMCVTYRLAFTATTNPGGESRRHRANVSRSGSR